MHRATMICCSVLFCLLTILCACELSAGGTADSFLVRERYSGVYGNRVDPSSDTRHDWQQDKYISFNRTYTYSIDIDGMFFDESTYEVYVSTLNKKNERSVIVFRLCPEYSQDSAQTRPHRFLFRRTKIAHRYERHPMQAFCESKCGWGPFAAHDGQVYFVYSSVVVGESGAPQRQIQLRVLKACEDMERHEDSSYSFDAFSCSRLVAVFHRDREDVKRPTPQWPKVWTAGALKIARLTDGSLAAFVLLFDENDESTNLKLVHVSLNTSAANGTVSVLHSSAMRHPADKNVRSIDYNNGTLCFTSSDQIFCGVFFSVEDTFSAVQLFKPGELADSLICRPDFRGPGHTSLAGLAIAVTRPYLAVYFSCGHLTAGLGHLGLVRLSHNGLRRRLTAVKAWGGVHVEGGALLAVVPPSRAGPCTAGRRMEGGGGRRVETLTTVVPPSRAGPCTAGRRHGPLALCSAGTALHAGRQSSTLLVVAACWVLAKYTGMITATLL